MRSITLLFLLFFSVFSFGKTGHRIVGQIAFNHLSPEAKKEIQRLLGHSNIAMVSNWADFIKSDKTWRYAGDWHYETVPDSLTVEAARGHFKGNLLNKISEFRDVLADNSASKKEKIIALKFLIHLIGDLHQPLHVGNGKDRGGNQVNVEWFRKKTNLHSVWDSKMIDDQKLSYKEYATYLEDISTEKMRANWISSSVNEWAEESKSLRKNIYDIGKGKLYYPYNYKNKEILDKRLAQAGFRLANLLNEAFSS
jgi:hypothetical protein